MIKAYSKFLDILEKIQKVILTVSVPAMVLIMFYQVVMRYVFHNSPAWSEELVRYLFIFNVMMAAAIAVRRNSHLQIDILPVHPLPGAGAQRRAQHLRWSGPAHVHPLYLYTHWHGADGADLRRGHSQKHSGTG